MRSGERGIVLVQVVVMAVVLGLIATYMVQWAFQRYQLVWRHRQFTASAAGATACLNQIVDANFVGLVQGTLPANNTNNGTSNNCGGGNYVITGSGAASRTVRWSRSNDLAF